MISAYVSPELSLRRVILRSSQMRNAASCSGMEIWESSRTTSESLSKPTSAMTPSRSVIATWRNARSVKHPCARVTGMLQVSARLPARAFSKPEYTAVRSRISSNSLFVRLPRGCAVGSDQTFSQKRIEGAITGTAFPRPLATNHLFRRSLTSPAFHTRRHLLN